jgi:uncharacterized protein
MANGSIILPSMTDSLSLEFNVPAVMRDGVTLRANVLRPNAPGQYPVALLRTPYGKDFATINPVCDAVRLARAGYIVALQDVRGRFASEGVFRYPTDERTDGYDSVEWAARLPGSNGAVGMFGASFSGIAQWAAARAQPPHLRAIVPTMAPANALDGAFWRGGALELGLLSMWQLANSIDRFVRRSDLEPFDKFMRIGAAVFELDHLAREGYFELPLIEFPPLARVELGDELAPLLSHPYEAEFLEAISVCRDYARIAVPSLNVGGWYDIFAQGTLHNFSALRPHDSRLVMGPWAHMITRNVVGDIDFGFASDMSFMNLQTDMTGLTIKFFDYHLKGIDNGWQSEAPVKLFVMGENYWRDEDEYPLARTRYEKWYLHSRGSANTLNGDGALSGETPRDEPPDHFVYDPANPVLTDGGAFLMSNVFHPGAHDQRTTEARRDVLVYTSAPLENDLEVTGPIVMHVFAASDAPDTDFVARLVDVHPDGFAQNLADGIVRARYRHGAPEEFLLPDEVAEFVIDLWATSNVFRAGHRVRVDVTSSNFPRWDRNPNTGAPLGRDTALQVAHQTICHDAAHPSLIILPIIPR